MHNRAGLFILLVMLISGCREKYVPNVNNPVTGYLVVDGFINSGPGPTTIVLSRTTRLSAGITIQYETKAKVSVEGKLNTTAVLLNEVTGKPGNYSVAQLTLNPADQYRLRIITQAGREYLSEYSAVRRTPAIDSISWKEETDGVYVYGNTHNTQDPVGFYRWTYDETWEIHSQYLTRFKAYNDAKGVPHHIGYRDSATRGYDYSMYFCWKNDTARSILVTSTEKLTENRVAFFPMRFIRRDAEEIGVRYSMNAKLYSISKDNLKFLEQLKKNTELLGSIFDPQPSDNYGNIRCVTVPGEIVVGFIEVSEEKVKRIFIDRQQLQEWRYRQGCPVEDTIANIPPLNLSAGAEPTEVSKWNFNNSNLIDCVYIAPTICVDCRLRGYNKRPAFW